MFFFNFGHRRGPCKRCQIENIGRDQYYKTIFAIIKTALKLWQYSDVLCEIVSDFSSGHICAFD